MARTGVTFDDISQAATKLLSMGESPSVQKVREVLGTGSNSTIAEHLKRWKLQRSTQESVALPEAIPKELIPPLETLWHIAVEHADQRYLQYKKHTQQQIDALTTERDTWKEQSQTVEKQLSETQQTLANRQTQLTDTQFALEKSEDRANQRRLVIEQTKSDNESLKQRLSEQKQYLADRENDFLIEYQQQVDTFDKQVSELKIDLQKEQERSDASEARWLRIVDQAKEEVKAINKKLATIETEKNKTIREFELKIASAHENSVKKEKQLLQSQTILDQQTHHIKHLKQTITHLEDKLQQSEKRLESWHEQLSVALNTNKQTEEISD